MKIVKLACALLVTAWVSSSHAAIIQTNIGTTDPTIPGNGTIPSYFGPDEPDHGLPSGDLLETSLWYATHSGITGTNTSQYFYREGDPTFEVKLELLTNGYYTGYEAQNYNFIKVMPNHVSITFAWDIASSPNGYNISEIASYAGWDSGRDGQYYSVEVSDVRSPVEFSHLYRIDPFNIPMEDFPLMDNSYHFGDVPMYDTAYANTLVTVNDSNGLLAKNVAAVRFIFNGFENGGTAYREIDVWGTSAPSAVPLPSAVWFFGSALFGLTVVGRNRRRKSGTSLPA